MIRMFTEVQGNTIIRRMFEGRLTYYNETITDIKHYNVILDALAYIEQLRIELRETKTLLDEAYELIQKQK